MTTETTETAGGSDQVWVDDYVTSTGVHVAGHWRKKTHGRGGSIDLDCASSEAVGGKPPARAMDTFGAQVGDRFERDGKTYEAVRITPAGSGGRGRASGPVVHLKAVVDGQVQPPGQGKTYDVQTTSMSDPASAYTRAPAGSQDKVKAGLAALRAQRERSTSDQANKCSTCGQFKSSGHTCRAADGVVVDAQAAAAAGRYVDEQGDVAVTEYVPHSGKTSWSVTGPNGTYLVTPIQGGQVEVWRSDSSNRGRTCADVDAGIGRAARLASGLPGGRPGSEPWLSNVAGSLESAPDGVPTHIPEVEGHGGVQLSERNRVDHAETGPGQGTFTVWSEDRTGELSNPTEHPYGPRAGFISSPHGYPVTKGEAARSAAEEVAHRQQPRRCDGCGQYLPYDGSHSCPSSSADSGRLAQGGTSPAAAELDTQVDDTDQAAGPVEGLPAGNYGDLKGDDRVKAMVADLEEYVKAVVESGRLGEWLTAMASNGMNRWSANNRILAMVQMWQRGVDINGLHLMGFRQWEKFNRKVSKGAKAVWILAPITRKITEEDDDGNKTERSRVVGFKGVPVFNVSDTAGDPLPSNPGKPAPGEATPGTLEGLRSRVGVAGYSHEEIEIPDCRPETGEGTLGYTDPTTKKIVVDSRLSNAQKAATIAHELGHVHCGHVDGDYSEYRKHRGRMETEAEMAGYLTMRSRGATKEQVDSFSPAYIAGWSHGDAKVMHAAVDKAVRAHNKILDGDWPTT